MLINIRKQIIRGFNKSIVGKIHSAGDYFLILDKRWRGRCFLSGKPARDPVSGVILSQDIRVSDVLNIQDPTPSVFSNLNNPTGPFTGGHTNRAISRAYASARAASSYFLLLPAFRPAMPYFPCEFRRKFKRTKLLTPSFQFILIFPLIFPLISAIFAPAVYSSLFSSFPPFLDCCALLNFRRFFSFFFFFFGGESQRIDFLDILTKI